MIFESTKPQKTATMGAYRDYIYVYSKIIFAGTVSVAKRYDVRGDHSINQSTKGSKKSRDYGGKLVSLCNNRKQITRFLFFFFFLHK